MIKPFFPSSNSIKKWAYKKSKPKFMPEWDERITTIKNANLLLALVLDQNCPRRASILKCLYSLVGTSVSVHVKADIAKINVLLDKARLSPDQVVLNWVTRSRMILGDLKKYDYIEWCEGGFSEKDLPIVN